jgi:hypothetical protein
LEQSIDLAERAARGFFAFFIFAIGFESAAAAGLSVGAGAWAKVALLPSSARAAAAAISTLSFMWDTSLRLR